MAKGTTPHEPRVRARLHRNELPARPPERGADRSLAEPEPGGRGRVRGARPSDAECARYSPGARARPRRQGTRREVAQVTITRGRVVRESELGKVEPVTLPVRAPVRGRRVPKEVVDASDRARQIVADAEGRAQMLLEAAA